MPYSKDLRAKADQMNEIIPGLFLGNEPGSQNEKLLKKNKIQVIVNATPRVPNKFISQGISYIRIPLDDSLKKKDIDLMTAWLPYVVDELKKVHRDQKKRVLVHCHAGMQRSAVVVAAYLIDIGKFPCPEPGKLYNSRVVKFIVDKRPIAFHNGEGINFEESLKEFCKNRTYFTIRGGAGPGPKTESKQPKKPTSRKATTSTPKVKKATPKPKKPLSPGSRRIRIL